MSASLYEVAKDITVVWVTNGQRAKGAEDVAMPLWRSMRP